MESCRGPGYAPIWEGGRKKSQVMLSAVLLGRLGLCSPEGIGMAGITFSLTGPSQMIPDQEAAGRT